VSKQDRLRNQAPMMEMRSDRHFIRGICSKDMTEKNIYQTLQLYIIFYKHATFIKEIGVTQ